MPACVIVDANNVLKATTDSVQDCSSYIIVDATEYTVMLQAYDITAVDIGASFLWGFSTYAVFWFIGLKSKVGREAVRRI